MIPILMLLPLMLPAQRGFSTPLAYNSTVAKGSLNKGVGEHFINDNPAYRQDHDINWNKVLKENSSLEPLKGDLPDNFQVAKVKFNPATGILNVPISVDKDSNIRIFLNSMKGRRLGIIHNDRMEPGNYRLELNCHDFPSKKYFISVDNGVRAYNKAFEVVK